MLNYIAFLKDSSKLLQAHYNTVGICVSLETVTFLFCHPGKNVQLFSQFHFPSLIHITKILDSFCLRFCQVYPLSLCGFFRQLKNCISSEKFGCIYFSFPAVAFSVSRPDYIQFSKESNCNFQGFSFSLPQKCVIGESCLLISNFSPLFKVPKPRGDYLACKTLLWQSEQDNQMSFFTYLLA